MKPFALPYFFLHYFNFVPTIFSADTQSCPIDGMLFYKLVVLINFYIYVFINRSTDEFVTFLAGFHDLDLTIH